MSSTAARQGIPSQARQQQAEKSEQMRLEAALLLENGAWKGAVEPLKAAYLDALLNCPPSDDKLRYQLQMALKVFDAVEKHIISAHTTAEFDAKKAIKADFGPNRFNLFRR